MAKTRRVPLVLTLPNVLLFPVNHGRDDRGLPPIAVSIKVTVRSRIVGKRRVTFTEITTKFSPVPQGRLFRASRRSNEVVSATQVCPWCLCGSCEGCGGGIYLNAGQSSLRRGVSEGSRVPRQTPAERRSAEFAARRKVEAGKDDAFPVRNFKIKAGEKKTTAVRRRASPYITIRKAN